MDLDEIQEWKDAGFTWIEIGEKLTEKYEGDAYHLSERARKQIYKRQTKRNLTNGNKTSDISTTSFDSLNDSDSLLRLHGYNPDEWSIVDSSCTIRNNSINTRIKVKPNDTPRIDVDKLSKDIEKALSVVKIEEREYNPDNDDVLFFNLFDLHYGRKYRDKNHINTTEDVLNATDDIVNHYKNNKPKSIEFPLGQDMFNTDNPFNTTTKGTPQTNSLEWYEMYAKGTALIVQIINKLSTLAPVNIRHSKGNHDAVLSYTLVQALALKYEKCDYINVDITFNYRQYIELDNVLIGITHGNEEKNLHAIMQSEAREAWGRCEHHIWFTGHVHHFEAIEKDGVTIYKCPSLAFVDDYHDIHAYTDAKKSLVCFRIDKNGVKEIYFGNPTSR